MTAFLESWGTGVSRMVEACKAVGLPEPEYGIDGGFVWITFMRPNSVTNSITNSVTNSDTNLDTYINKKQIEPENNTTDDVKDDVKDGVKDDVKQTSDIQHYLIYIIKNNPYITTKELAQKTNIKFRTLQLYISQLQSMGILVRKGSRKDG